MRSHHKTWHLNTEIEVRIKRLVLAAILIVPLSIFKFRDERKKTYLTRA